MLQPLDYYCHVHMYTPHHAVDYKPHAMLQIVHLTPNHMHAPNACTEQGRGSTTLMSWLATFVDIPVCENSVYNLQSHVKTY